MATQNRYYSNVANVTTLTNSGGISNSGTNLVVGSTTGFPVQFPFILRLEPATLTEEVVLVNSGSGTVGTPYVITRGFDGTTARAHAAGVVVKHGFAQIDFADPQVHLNATGPGGSPNPHSLPDMAWTPLASPLIGTQVLGSTATTITISSIPSSFTHLRLSLIGTSASGSSPDTIYMQLNGDTGSNYLNRFLTESSAANGATATWTISTATTTKPLVSSFPNAGTGICTVEIPGYDTSFGKMWTSISHGGPFSTGSHQAGTYYGVWNSTAAITSITVGTTSGSGFVAGTTMSLYGAL